jgi:hypothetical protein
MRYLLPVLVALVAVGCADPAPTGIEAGESPLLQVGRAGAPPTVFNTQLTAEDEIPTSTSESKGHSHFKVLANGTIQSRVMINNKDLEVFRFCHIHWIDPAAVPAGTGPIIWWLTPTGVNLGNDDRIIRISQDAEYVTNTPFGADEDSAREALLADPSEFYVNCHSDRFPPGFIRGNLP